MPKTEHQEKATVPFRSLGILPLLILLLSICCGCATYEEQSRRMYSAFRSGNFAAAGQKAADIADDDFRNRDYLLWRLEEGTARRAAGDIDGSIQTFAKAEYALDRQAQTAQIRLGTEAAALFTTQANLPYHGYAYDGIMLNTYQTLNYLAKGDLSAARVHLTRAYERQRDAVHDNRKRIENLTRNMQENDQRQLIQATRENPALQQKLDRIYAAQRPGNGAKTVYADYVNPFTVWLEGIFYLNQATDSADLERARLALRRAAEFAPANDYIQIDRHLADSLTPGTAPPPIVHVIFENGLAPIREQTGIELPILFENISYIGIALPQLVFNHGQAAALEVHAENSFLLTQQVASMDRIISRDFENELPLIISKTIASTVIKTVAAYAANREASRHGPAAELLARLGTAALQAAVNIADLRTWRTLPKEFQICRLPLPPDRRLRLKAAGSTVPPVELQLEHGNVFIISVKSVAVSSPLTVSVMIIR